MVLRIVFYHCTLVVYGLVTKCNFLRERLGSDFVGFFVENRQNPLVFQSYEMVIR